MIGPVVVADELDENGFGLVFHAVNLLRTSTPLCCAATIVSLLAPVVATSLYYQRQIDQALRILIKADVKARAERPWIAIEIDREADAQFTRHAASLHCAITLTLAPTAWAQCGVAP